MAVVVRRYIDFLIILLIPTPLVLALFLQQHSYILLCPFKKNVFCSLQYQSNRVKICIFQHNYN